MTTSPTPNKEALAEARKQLAMTNVMQFMSRPENKDLYFVTTDNKFFRYLPESKMWTHITKDALRMSNELIRKDIEWDILLNVMEGSGRFFNEKTYSFRPQPQGEILNMMKTEDWLQPVFETTENTRFFNYVLNSLGNRKPENIEHIKQVIGWKYLHPEAWNLPALCFYGRGGSGKNLLSKTLMSVIFGQRQVLVTNFRKLEKFDAALAGKTVVMFDEHPNKEDQSTLKAIIGQPTLTVEPKNVNIFETDNTALYIIATNEPTGPVRIEKNGSERRFSLIRSDIDHADIVAENEKITREEAIALIAWADINVYRNSEEVAAFLGQCILAAQELTAPPKFLHGEDFKELVTTQKDSTDEILEEVFVDYEGFDFITLQGLFDLYRARLAQTNPGATPMAVQKFNGRVTDYISQHATLSDIKRTDHRVNLRQKGAKPPIKATVYYSGKKFPFGFVGSENVDNTELYLSRTHLCESPRQAKMSKLEYELNKTSKS